MRFAANSIIYSVVALALAQSTPARAEDPDLDALSLTSAPVEKAADKPQRMKLFIEGAAGIADHRFGNGTQTLGRASVDFAYDTRLSSSWQARISDRLDAVHPAAFGGDTTVNSLREAYLSWQQGEGNTIVDIGRVGLRYGPAYGYNPTDFFRDGTLRTVTTANPFTLRENRLGTVALRAQRLWSSGSLAMVYSPKIVSRPSLDGSSLDLGATNNRNRALVTLSNQVSERVSGQVLVGKERGLPAQVGASMTALVTNAAVAHAEWSRASEPDLLSRTTGQSEPRSTRNRFSGGLTYTTSTKLSITGEYEYNGFALDGANPARVRNGDFSAWNAYLLQAQDRQDLASRQAYFFYLTQQSIGVKNLDLTALLRTSIDDHSRLAWVELRYHWNNVDLALQLQQQSRGATSEYAWIPYQRSAQIVAAYYFK